MKMNNKKPRAPRMVDLFVRYSKRSSKAFVNQGLDGCVVYAKTKVPGAAYKYPIITIFTVCGEEKILEIHGEGDYEPRTKAYNSEYSDRLGKFMDALENATDELELANQLRIDKDNAERKERRHYEECLF